MSWHILHIAIGLVAFMLFVFLQSLFIMGLKLSFEKGEILDWWPGVVKTYIKNEYWQKPFYACVRCMASFFGAITYWPVVFYFFGVKAVEFPVFVADVFILVFLNYYIYRKV